jgi:uncharacterized membrane protein YidH (DUF202 family)
MKITALRLIGIALLIVSIVVLMSGGVRWTERKTLVDAGPVEITRQEHHAMTVPPMVGIVSLLAGIILVVLPSRRRVR